MIQLVPTPNSLKTLGKIGWLIGQHTCVLSVWWFIQLMPTPNTVRTLGKIGWLVGQHTCVLFVWWFMLFVHPLLRMRESVNNI